MTVTGGYGSPPGTGEALQLLGAILRSPKQAIISTTVDGRIMTWNVGAERIYGYEAAEVVGRSMSLVVQADHQAAAEDRLARASSGEELDLQESVHVTKHAASIDVSLAISPIRGEYGDVVGICAIVRDVTAQRWMAATLETTLKALEEALEGAKVSAVHSQRFLADAAHQLRSPLAGIQACADALVRGPSESKREDLFVNLLRETSRAARLITGLLHIAQVDQGEVRVPRPCDLSHLCAQEADRLRVVSPELDIEVSLPDTATGETECDADAVHEIVSNLLDNARRHAASTIRLSMARDARTVEIRVDDDGPGVPETLRQRVFERFVSLDGKGGSGLGLPIARGLARALRGDLTYEGGAFVLRLPVMPTAAEPWGGQVAPPASAPDAFAAGSAPILLEDLTSGGDSRGAEQL